MLPPTQDAYYQSVIESWKNNEWGNDKLSPCKWKLVSKDCVGVFVQVSAFSSFGKKLWVLIFNFTLQMEIKVREAELHFAEKFYPAFNPKIFSAFLSKLQKSFTVTFYVNHCSFVSNKSAQTSRHKNSAALNNKFLIDFPGTRDDDRKSFSCIFEQAFIFKVHLPSSSMHDEFYI